MALTLVEAANIALGKDEVYKASIMELFARSSDLVRTLPFENISGNALTYLREKELPATGFRGVNEGYTESTGKVDKIIESLAIAGGDIDVDKFLVDTMGTDQRTTQEGLKVKSLSLAITKNLIKGDVLSDIKSFDGLQTRCLGDQLVVAGSTANGTPLSLAKLDELIDATEEPTHLIMNKAMRRRITQAARNTAVGGFISWEKDEFGQKIAVYQDLPILIIDKDETNTDIMPFNETCSSGTATGTSIYCASLNDSGLVGLQNNTMDVRDLGEQEDKPVYRTRIEWYIAMTIMRERAASRLWSISDVAVTV